MRIHFYLRFHTEYGQQLQINGNLQAFRTEEGKALGMTYLNQDYWHAIIESDPNLEPICNYAYQLVSAEGKIIQEWGKDRSISLIDNQEEEIQVIDAWNHAGEFENAFYTSPFNDILLSGHEGKKPKFLKSHSHVLKVKAPLLRKNEVICVAGSGTALGDWDTKNPILCHLEGNWWTAFIDLPKEDFPLHYKYGVYNTKSESFVRFESGDNRVLFGDANRVPKTLVHDGFAYLPNNTWKGTGTAIPVFSLRSKESFGVGEFTDLPLLIDWARSVNMKLIQLLPINDTSATLTWTDSYPYAAISAFALHPIFVNLEKVAGKKQAEIVKALKKKQKQLNELPEVDYEEVLKTKLSVLKELFREQKEELQTDPEYLVFFEKNKHWLLPYAAFSYLRDKHGTADFTQWKQHSVYDAAAIEKFVAPRLNHYDEICFHYYLQFHLHQQLKAATNYAQKHGIIVKGDIPIGIYRYSCDAWMAPQLYNMDQQAGAPPDDFAVKGQNWGFPTYNWNKMEEDDFAWWKRRFEQMSEYFDAFRIDHILGFFRIWSIPLHAVEGIMGRFVPAIPVHISEFQQRNIWFEYHRFTRPYITDQILWDYFGNLKLGVQNTFLDATGFGEFIFKEAFNTQRKIEQYFLRQEQNEENKSIMQGLFDLHANVILFEVEGSDRQQFHFRFAMEKTPSFQALEYGTQQALRDLYVNYFYRRQDEFWMQEAMNKLPALKAATNMLICGEDLGMVPACVPEAMKQLGILSLEIQRMPKDPKKEFFHPNDAPYLSVVTPSTHDMSTIRGWWEEDRAKTQKFFNDELGQWGEAPVFCEPWINKLIILQHLHSPAMWSIFQLQDLLGMDGALRRNNPSEERINVPATPKHYWRYRLHITLEDLIKEKSFNNDLKEYIKSGGRA